MFNSWVSSFLFHSFFFILQIKGSHFFLDHGCDKFRWLHNEYRAVQMPGDGFGGTVDDQACESRVYEVAYHNQVCFHVDGEADNLIPMAPPDQVTHRIERRQ